MSSLETYPADLLFYPYSQEYFDLYKEATLVDLREKYLENVYWGTEMNSYYSEDSMVTQYREDAVDAVSNVIGGIMRGMKNIFERIFNFFTNFAKKITNSYNGIHKNPNEVTIRDICKKGHIWTAPQVEQMIASAGAGDLKYWSKLKMSKQDPDVVDLMFDQTCSKVHKAALQNLLNFMLIKDKDATIDVSTLVTAGSPQTKSEAQKGEKSDMFAFWWDKLPCTKAVTKIGLKWVAAGVGIFSVGVISSKLSNIYTKLSDADVVTLQQLQKDLDGQIASKKMERMMINIGDFWTHWDKSATELQQTKDKLIQLNDEIRQLQHERDVTSRKLNSGTGRRGFKPLSPLAIVLTGDPNAGSNGTALAANPTLRIPKGLITRIIGILVAAIGVLIVIFGKFAIVFDGVALAYNKITNTGKEIAYAT